MNRFKLFCIKNRDKVLVNEYKTEIEVLEDIEFRNSLIYFIMDEETKKCYTFDEFKDTFFIKITREEEQTYIDLFELLLEKITTDRPLEFQEILINNKSYSFEEVYDNGWETHGEYLENYYIYRVYIHKDGEFIEDLNMFLRQDCTKFNTPFEYYGYQYETPFLVKEKVKTIQVKEWVAL